MLEDSILRCRISVRCDGQTSDQIFEAVKEGDFFLVVLEWGRRDNAEGVTPRQCVQIPSSEIEVEPDPSRGYELVSRMGIDLDGATITDVPEASPRSFKEIPKE